MHLPRQIVPRWDSTFSKLESVSTMRKTVRRLLFAMGFQLLAEAIDDSRHEPANDELLGTSGQAVSVLHMDLIERPGFASELTGRV